MKLTQGTTALAFLLFAGIGQATSSLPAQIRSELEDSLYPFAIIVPGYQRPAASAPKFAVAEFRVSSDELFHLSRAVSEILRYRIQYVPNVRLYMPAPYFTYEDAQSKTITGRPLLTGRIAFQNLHKALGIESVLTGSLAFDGNEYALSAELVDLVNENNSLQRDWRFTAAELPASLISVSEWVYQSLGVELTPKQRAYLQDRKSLDRQAIEDFVLDYAELQASKGPLKMDRISQLRTLYPDFIIFSIYAFQNRVYATNLDDAYKNLDLYESIRALHPGNAGIELESYRAMDIESLPKHVIATRLNSMKELVKDNPHDPNIMINFANALVKNGSTLEGIATMLEAVQRWPNYYRAWWSLGWALNQHAWQVRGHSMWRDVPEQAKSKYKILVHLSDLAIDEALALNPSNGQLWNMKLNSIGSLDGYSEKLMEVFNNAAELAPNEGKLYENALNFSADKWGGNSEARQHIIELAIKNNPEAPWPVAMRNHHISDFDGSREGLGPSVFERYLKKVIDHPVTWKLVLGFIGLVLWIAYTIGKRAPKDKAGPRDDSSYY